MANNLGDLVQMIATLSGIQNQKQQIALREKEIQQQASQFADAQEGSDFQGALKLIASSSAKAREGYQTLLNTLAPAHKEAAMAYLQNQPIDPSVTHAADITAGHAALSPQMLQAVQQEAAVGASTGGGVGQLAQSQLGGILAGGAMGQVTPAMVQGYAQRSATGQDPVAAAVGQSQVAQGLVPAMARIAAGTQQTAGQAASTGLGYANLSQGWAQLDQGERKMAAEYGLEKMYKEAEISKMTGKQFTGQNWLDAVGRMSSILNDINKNSSDKASNYGRIRLYNQLAPAVGVPTLPLEGDGMPGKPGLMTQMGRSIFGGPDIPIGGGVAWPIMTSPVQGGQR